MAEPTTGELFKAKTITEEEVSAAVVAYLADETTGEMVLGDGYRLDLAEAVRSHPFANATMAGGNATNARKRSAVRTAILLARPVKG